MVTYSNLTAYFSRIGNRHLKYPGSCEVPTAPTDNGCYE